MKFIGKGILKHFACFHPINSTKYLDILMTVGKDYQHMMASKHRLKTENGEIYI